MDTKIVLVICASLFILVIIFFLFGFIIQYQRKSNAFAAEKKVMQAAFEQELLKTQLEISEQTLKHISQEIHDNIGQILSLAKLHLNTMDVGTTAGLPEKINSSRELITKAIQDLRSLSKNLDADAVSLRGIYVAALTELELVQRAGLHQVYTTLQGHPYPLGSNTELILFRIFQELINNIIKHASAGTIKVDFKYEPGQFTLQIADDGKGFDLSRLADAQNRDRGLGIKNMQNRAKMVQADFFMESTIGKGTKAVITVKN